MDLRQLRYFVSIVQSGSISKASFALGVAQPALSLHVRNMEANLGVSLLFRTPHGVLPTEAGLILLRNAEIILAQFEQASREIRGCLAEPTGEVRLGLPGTISQILGVPLVIAARERYPKITLRIAEAMSGYVLDWLRLGRVDLGLLFQHVEDKDFRSIALLTEALVLLGPARPALDLETQPQPDPVGFASLAGLPLILPSPGHGLRNLIDEHAAATGVPLRTGIDIDAYGAIKALVEEGLGYSILPAQAVRQEVEEGRLRAWTMDPPLSRTVHMVLPCRAPPAQATSAIEELCRVTLHDLVGSGRWDSARMHAEAWEIKSYIGSL